MPQLEKQPHQLILSIDAEEQVEYLADEAGMVILLEALRELLSGEYLLTDSDEVAEQSEGAICHLTSSPLIMQDAEYDEHTDTLQGYKELYWYPNYQVDDPFKRLLQTMMVVFTKA